MYNALISYYDKPSKQLRSNMKDMCIPTQFLTMISFPSLTPLFFLLSFFVSSLLLLLSLLFCLLIAFGVFFISFISRSPIYGLCVSMLVINYVQICLPCIVAMIMIPVFCFCMPCLIRLLARLHDPRATEGAPAAAIDALPLVVIDNEHIRTYLSDNGTCPICLNDMLLGEEARLLQCKHIFHKQCVDEWLRVNASCPTCRYRVLDGNDRPGGETQQGGDHGVEIGNTLLRGEGQGQGQLQGQGQGQGGGHEPSGLIRQTESPSGEIPRQLRLNVNLGR